MSDSVTNAVRDGSAAPLQVTASRFTCDWCNALLANDWSLLEMTGPLLRNSSFRLPLLDIVLTKSRNAVDRPHALY